MVLCEESLLFGTQHGGVWRHLMLCDEVLDDMLLYGEALGEEKQYDES